VWQSVEAVGEGYRGLAAEQRAEFSLSGDAFELVGARVADDAPRTFRCFAVVKVCVTSARVSFPPPLVSW
jgi:hypothetical protein